MYGPSLHYYLVGIQILCMVQAVISIKWGYRYYVWSKPSSLSSGDTDTMYGQSPHLYLVGIQILCMVQAFISI